MNSEMRSFRDHEIEKLQRAIKAGRIQRAAVLWWERFEILDIKVTINPSTPAESINLSFLLSDDEDDDRLMLSDFDLQ